MTSHLRSITAKAIAPRLCTALTLSALVWLGGLQRAEAGVNVWTTNGPYARSISDLVVDPQNPATVYGAVRTSENVCVGVFKSTDGGGNVERREYRRDRPLLEYPGHRPADANHPLCGHQLLQLQHGALRSHP
jgi:hypothetical protein